LFGLLVSTALLAQVTSESEASGATAGGTVNSLPAGEATHDIYLSLGDSVPVWDGNHSFPNILTGYYRKDVPHLELVNMACSGESTQSMIAHSDCAPGGSQLKNAVDFLRQHRGSVALVTMDIGGNDVVYCIGQRDSTTCVTNGLHTMAAQLTYILDALHQAAGPNVPIVGMNVYNPLLGDLLGPESSRALAAEAIAALPTLNQDMDNDYGVSPSPVADVQDSFDATELTHFVSSKWGRVPIAVARACTLLDITCHKGQSEGFGDDPNDAGAKVIAKAFEQAIGVLQPPQ
jgi:lysophospholipase L1-like esterase